MSNLKKLEAQILEPFVSCCNCSRALSLFHRGKSTLEVALVFTTIIITVTTVFVISVFVIVATIITLNDKHVVSFGGVPCSPLVFILFQCASAVSFPTLWIV